MSGIPPGVPGDRHPNVDHAHSLRNGRTSIFRLQAFDPSVASRTWDLFRTLWPQRGDPFSQAMNAATKAVVTHRPVDETEWAHSHAIDAPLAQWVRREVATTDIAVIGSLSVAAALEDQGLVQEYRLLTFPTVLGTGRGLFRGRRELTLISSEHVGPAVLAVLAREPQERS